MKKGVWLTIVLVLVALLAALLAANREDIVYYVKVAGAYLTGRRFYANYAHLERDIAFHPEMDPRLDVYSPAEGADHPVLVFYHGGGWTKYSKVLFAPVAMKLLPEGLVVVIPDYTLYPEAQYEQMTHEVAAALSWVLEHIGDHGGDPRRVVVAGHSAGAHLSALAVMDPRFLSTYGHSSNEICALVGLSGVYDVAAEYDYWLAQGHEATTMEEVMGGRQNFAAASPIRHVRAGLPPVFLLHGSEDESVPVQIAVDFDAALRAAGVAGDLTVYEGAAHSDYLFSALTQERAPIVVALSEIVGECGPNPLPSRSW
jgi:acetyl esterase/lipase